MQNKKMWGAAVLGVLLAVAFSTDLAARSVGWLYGQTLRIADTEGRGGTVLNTLGVGDAYIQGDLEVAGQQYDVVPATQTLSATFTITADACGGLKRISATGSPTSDTTNTFTAPASTNKGCRMMVKNVGTTDIILDANALFPVTSAGSLTLAGGGSIEVWSDGSFWRKGFWTEY